MQIVGSAHQCLFTRLRKHLWTCYFCTSPLWFRVLFAFPPFWQRFVACRRTLKRRYSIGENEYCGEMQLSERHDRKCQKWKGWSLTWIDTCEGLTLSCGRRFRIVSILINRFGSLVAELMGEEIIRRVVEILKMMFSITNSCDAIETHLLVLLFPFLFRLFWRHGGLSTATMMIDCVQWEGSSLSVWAEDQKGHWWRWTWSVFYETWPCSDIDFPESSFTPIPFIWLH